MNAPLTLMGAIFLLSLGLTAAYSLTNAAALRQAQTLALQEKEKICYAVESAANGAPSVLSIPASAVDQKKRRGA